MLTSQQFPFELKKTSTLEYSKIFMMILGREATRMIMIHAVCVLQEITDNDAQGRKMEKVLNTFFLKSEIEWKW